MKRRASHTVAARNAAIRDRIEALKAEHPFWGYRRVWAQLRFTDGLVVNRKRILRLMREHHWIVPQNPRLRASRTPTHSKPKPHRPNQWWGIDMTKVMVEAYEMVEDGLMSDDDFKAFTFGNVVEMHTGMNPDFFKGTVIEDAVAGVEAGRNGGFGLVVGVARHGNVASLREAGADVVVTTLEDLAGDADPRAGAGRLLRGPTVFEDLAKLVLTTNCSWALTTRMVERLIALAGVAADDGARAFPGPAALARLSESTLRDRARTGYRAPLLRGLCRAVAAGEVGLSAGARRQRSAAQRADRQPQGS